MTLLELGPDPGDLEVTLIRDATFTAVISLVSGEWDDADTLTLTLGDLDLDATFDGADATFTATAEEVNAVLATGPYIEAGMWLTTADEATPWFLGRVNRA